MQWYIFSLVVSHCSYISLVNTCFNDYLGSSSSWKLVVGAFALLTKEEDKKILTVIVQNVYSVVSGDPDAACSQQLMVPRPPPEDRSTPGPQDYAGQQGVLPTPDGHPSGWGPHPGFFGLFIFLGTTSRRTCALHWFVFQFCGQRKGIVNKSYVKVLTWNAFVVFEKN